MGARCGFEARRQGSSHLNHRGPVWFRGSSPGLLAPQPPGTGVVSRLVARGPRSSTTGAPRTSTSGGGVGEQCRDQGALDEGGVPAQGPTALQNQPVVEVGR